MGKIKVIEKAKGMEKEGAILLLKYHQELQETKMRRLGRQLDKTSDILDVIRNEVERREKEEKI